jgi:hypothetical protein
VSQINDALVQRPVRPYSGRAYRTVRRIYPPDNFGGSLTTAGRLHETRDGLTGYLSTNPVISLAESVRHLDVQGVLKNVATIDDVRRAVDEYLNDYLNTRRIWEFEVSLTNILDVLDLEAVGIDLDAFFQDPPGGWDAGGFVSQKLGRKARLLGHEGLLVPSVTLLGPNLIIYPDNLLAGSTLKPIRYWDPPLYPTSQP